MSFTIVNKLTFARHKAHGIGCSYETERAAKAQMTKAYKGHPDWTVMTTDYYYNNEPNVLVHNCLTGKPVVIRLSQRGGCCDPSMELYHTM